MPLTEAIRFKIIQLFCLIFFFIILFNFFTKAFLFQIVPAYFFNKLDFSTWLVMLLNIHKLPLNNRTACLLADMIYYLMPFIYFVCYLKRKNLAPYIGWLMVAVNFIYTVIYCLYPTESIEIHIALVVFPIIFIPASLKTFWFLLHAVRYFFLYYFASAGVWKIIAGGLFHPMQMSSILLVQHKEILISGTPGWMTDVYKWFIVHPAISHSFYVASTIFELSFIIGFFTKRLDVLLILFYLLFLIMDSLLMRIDYWQTLPFVLAMMYSAYKIPEASDKLSGSLSKA